MKYDFNGNSIKEFSKLPRKAQFQIMEKLELYMSASNPLSFAEHLTDFEFGEYRFRIGDYRVIFCVKEETIIVLAIGHRSEIYK